MEEKKARVVTRIGDIFCVEIDDKYKAYFQYIAKDWEQLNSTVIRVFKNHYPIDSNPSMEEIVNDEVAFYAHTVLQVGFKKGTWYKVGNSKIIGDVENIYFKIYPDVNYGLTGQKKSYKWYVWKINHEWEAIGEMKEQFQHYDMGFIYPYFDIKEKIITGEFLSKTLE